MHGLPIVTKRTAETSTAKIAKQRPSTERLDVAVAQQAGLTRERAQGLILAGQVKVDGVMQRKAGAKIATGAVIDIEARERYVSRGGFKLEQALRDFEWSPRGARCLDVGASTGGFTDCLLQHGAAAVVALDVGYGHLAWSLRQDSRVQVVERCNFRYADLAALGSPFAFVTADVSFISLSKLATQLRSSLTPDGKLVALVKPQFEAGRNAVKKGGVVYDQATQARAIEEVVRAFGDAGLAVEKLTYSPLKGPAGNIEFLIGARARAGGAELRALGARAELDIAGVVRKAHEALD